MHDSDLALGGVHVIERRRRDARPLQQRTRELPVRVVVVIVVVAELSRIISAAFAARRAPPLDGALAGVETRLFSASATLDEMSAHANAHDGSPSAHAQKEAERIERLESTFQAIASGVADLESITREVEGSAELPAAVKQQVAWNLRKMTADASKLRSDALDAPQRDALS